MARKKNTTKNDLLTWYMEFVLDNNQQPKSVFSFAKENNFEEANFYKFYTSFEAIEEGTKTLIPFFILAKDRTNAKIELLCFNSPFKLSSAKI